MGTGLKIFLFAIGALIAAFFIVLGITTATEGQKIANSGTRQAKEVSKEFSSIDRTIYDGTDVLGSTVVDVINSVIEEGEELAIGVHTNANADNTMTYYNYTRSTQTITHITPATVIQTIKNHDNYINPDALFEGKVYKDANNNIIALEFSQLK